MRIMRIGYFLMLLTFLALGSTVQAGGRKITILTRNGSAWTGELLSVRQNSVVVSLGVDMDEEILANTQSLIVVIPDSDITAIHSKGESHVGQGMAIGTGIGCVAGFVTFLAMESKAGDASTFGESVDYSLGGPILGVGLVVGGFLVGTVAGAASSTGDIDMGTAERFDFQKLVSESRYPWSEPDFLRKVK